MLQEFEVLGVNTAISAAGWIDIFDTSPLVQDIRYVGIQCRWIGKTGKTEATRKIRDQTLERGIFRHRDVELRHVSVPAKIRHGQGISIKCVVTVVVSVDCAVNKPSISNFS